MKKTIFFMCIILLMCSFTLVTAADGEELNISMALGALDTSDILGGILPTYIQAGVSLEIEPFIDDAYTDVRILLGGARTSYTMYTDQSGDPLTTLTGVDDDQLKFAFWQADLQAGLYQEIMDNAEVYARWQTEWALPVENSGGAASWILDPGASIAAYPDKDGMLANSLKIGLEYDTVTKGAMTEGIKAEVSLTAAPGFLLNEMVGKTDFYLADTTIKTYFPLYTIPMEDVPENQWLALYLANRIKVNYLVGEAIPQLYQESPSLGKKMRGFEKTSLGISFTAVDNFELRAAGPELILSDMSIGYPRVHLFADFGYCDGNYYNSAATGSVFTASAGIEAAIDIFNFVDIGYRYGFILAGETISGEPSFGELFFFLHW